MSLLQLTRSTLQAARVELEGIGMQRRKRGIYTLPVSGQVIGWLGLNTVHAPSSLGILPLVGVRNQLVEKVLADIRGDAFHDFIPPSYHISIGYLMPQRASRIWWFQDGKAPGPVARDLARAVLEFGFPYMRANGDLQNLYELGLQEPGDEKLSYRAAVAALLLDRKQDAAQVVAVRLGRLGSSQTLASQAYRAFAKNFMARLEQ